RLLVAHDGISELDEGHEGSRGVHEHRQELADRDLAAIDEPEHREHDRRAREGERRAFDESEETHEPQLPLFELEDVLVPFLRPPGLLPLDAEALHELDVANRFGCRTGLRYGLRGDALLMTVNRTADPEREDAEPENQRDLQQAEINVHVER